MISIGSLPCSEQHQQRRRNSALYRRSKREFRGRRCRDGDSRCCRPWTCRCTRCVCFWSVLTCHRWWFGSSVCTSSECVLTPALMKSVLSTVYLISRCTLATECHVFVYVEVLIFPRWVLMPCGVQEDHTVPQTNQPAAARVPVVANRN